MKTKVGYLLVVAICKSLKLCQTFAKKFNCLLYVYCTGGSLDETTAMRRQQAKATTVEVRSQQSSEHKKEEHDLNQEVEAESNIVSAKALLET